MFRFALWIVLAASAMLLFLSLWIVIPAPNYFLFPLAVGSPEISPVLLAGGIILTIIATGYARRGRVARAALACSAIATLLSLVPVVQAPFALARFNRAMAATAAEPPPKITPETFE